MEEQNSALGEGVETRTTSWFSGHRVLQDKWDLRRGLGMPEQQLTLRQMWVGSHTIQRTMGKSWDHRGGCAGVVS